MLKGDEGAEEYVSKREEAIVLLAAMLSVVDANL